MTIMYTANFLGAGYNFGGLSFTKYTINFCGSSFGVLIFIHLHNVYVSNDVLKLGIFILMNLWKTHLEIWPYCNRYHLLVIQRVSFEIIYLF